MVKNPPAMPETLVGKVPWRREQLLTPVFCPGELNGQMSLVGYSPWGLKESDMTKWLSQYRLREPCKSKWLDKGNPEEMPCVSDLNCQEGTFLSLSLPLCLSTCTILFFPPNKYLIFFFFYYFLSSWEFFSIKLKGQGLVTDYWCGG